MPLVLVGATNRWARELPGVKLTGHVGDDALAAIYTAAHALVFPSSDEGFGVPPIEALSCGTPVVASDCPAVREVLGDRIELREVGDLDGLIAAAEAARRPAPQPPVWTWDDAASATWDAYAKALAAPPQPRAGGARPTTRTKGWQVSESTGNPEQDAVYQRLRRLSEDLEDRSFFRSARLGFMRTRELAESQEALDGAQERLYDAVREARTLGMEWSVIADALRRPEEEVQERYASVDRM
jgi:hypothetical protein